MRAGAFALIVMLSPTAQAAEGCRWDDAGWPALRHHGRVIKYERDFVCPGEVAGELRVDLFAVRGKQRLPVGDTKVEVKARGRWERRKHVQEGAFPNNYCKIEGPKKAGAVLTGLESNGVDEFGAYEVIIEAKVTGTGRLAALNQTVTTKALCPRCSGFKSYVSSIRIKDGRANARKLHRDVRLVAETDAQWWACARAGATLELRWFVDDDKEAARNQLRPLFVQSGFQEKFRVAGKKAVMDEAVPWSRLCKANKKWVSWEAWGSGQLRRISGGSRNAIEIECR